MFGLFSWFYLLACMKLSETCDQVQAVDRCRTIFPSLPLPVAATAASLPCLSVSGWFSPSGTSGTTCSLLLQQVPGLLQCLVETNKLNQNILFLHSEKRLRGRGGQDECTFHLPGHSKGFTEHLQHLKATESTTKQREDNEY